MQVSACMSRPCPPSGLCRWILHALHIPAKRHDTPRLPATLHRPPRKSNKAAEEETFAEFSRLILVAGRGDRKLLQSLPSRTSLVRRLEVVYLAAGSP